MSKRKAGGGEGKIKEKIDQIISTFCSAAGKDPAMYGPGMRKLLNELVDQAQGKARSGECAGGWEQ